MAAKKNTRKRNGASKKRKPAQNSVHYSVHIITLILVAVLLGIFIYFDTSAFLATIIKEAILALFSISAYLLPLILIGLSIYVSQKRSAQRLTIKLVLSLVGCVLFASIYQTLFEGQIGYDELIYKTAYGYSGGLIGGTIANLLISLVGRVATTIILLFLIAVDISVIFKISIFNLIYSFVAGLFTLKNEAEEIDYEKSAAKGQKTAKKITDGVSNAKSHLTHRIDFSLDDDEDKKEKTDNKKAKISEEDIKARIDDIIFNQPEEKNNDEEIEEDITLGASLDDVDEIGTDDAAPADDGVQRKNPQRVSTTTDEERNKVKNEIENAIEQEVKEYVFPPISLLKKPPTASADKRREMQETANKLMEILSNFGVEAKLLQVTQGPSVTRYEIQPSTGVKLSKITGLAEDIALNLAVPTVLVAAVPGKAAVGIEVPNNSVSMVSVRELLESTKFKDASSKLTVAFGKDIGGNVVVGDIAKMPHVLIAGSTGSGKSVCINTIITSILYKATPDEVKLIMVDPKVVELGVYNGIPHLLIPVVTDPKKAAGALNWAVGEMMRRYALFAESGSRNLSGYNELMEKNGEQKLPQLVIVIDELADLMMVAAKEVEDYVCRLAQLARAAGIHLIIATQRPSVDVITGLIKANVPSRIAFAVSSQVDSRTILDKGGAEKLLGKGDMLYHPTGLSNALRVQGAFVSDAEIESIVTFIKENSEITHYSEDLENHLDAIASGDVASEESKDDDDADELLPAAIELAVELGQISTAMVQRRMKVGYARAGRIIDQMEARGIISGANGSKPREVYMNRINMTDYE